MQLLQTCKRLAFPSAAIGLKKYQRKCQKQPASVQGKVVFTVKFDQCIALEMKAFGGLLKVNRHQPFTAVHFRPIRAFRAPMSAVCAAKVDAQEGKKLLDDAGYAYLDVRTPEEYANGHVPGAVNVPVMFKSGASMAPNPDFVQQVEQAFPDKTANILVGCQAGRRSENAVAQMENAGYKELADLAPGFGAWQSAGLPIEK